MKLPALLSPMRDNRTRVLEAMIVVLLLVAAAILAPILTAAEGRRITAHFATTIGVYPGSDVRVLGVKVGALESIKPEGGSVKVVMKVDKKVKVPADARAIVIAPNLVSDRYVQLTPAYTGGAELSEGADIDVTRTATPMELDQLYDSVRRFSTDLGPQGANARGALSQFISTGAANLNGNGGLLNTTIADLGKASETLNDSSGDFYATISNLNRFSTMLKANEGRIRQIERQFAEVSGFLAADRDELGDALRNLAAALAKVKTFISENREKLARNVDKLADVTQILVDQRAALAEALDNTPLLLQNALQTYDPETRTLMSRGNLLEITKAFGSTSQPGVDPVSAATRSVCAAATGVSSPALRSQCERLRTGGLTAVPPSRTGGVPALPFPPAGPVYAGQNGKAGQNDEGGR
ncbi:MCE family protein [Spirillospora sp. NPDC047279]|uniref:MCE family protein n=1 Tax=Spirillospora sp. NPDC047279 TaxID=3155478 RepID=UPI0033D78E8E